MDGLIGSGKLTQRVKATITKVMQSITEKKAGMGLGPGTVGSSLYHVKDHSNLEIF